MSISHFAVRSPLNIPVIPKHIMYIMIWFGRSCYSPYCPVSSSTAAALDTVEFSRIPVLFKGSGYPSLLLLPSNFRKKVCLRDVCCLLSLSSFQLPFEYRDRIIHRSSNLLRFLVKPRKEAWSRPFILGRGRNKVVCWRSDDGVCHIIWVYCLLFWHLIDSSIRKMFSVLVYWVEFTQILKQSVHLSLMTNCITILM